MEKPSRVAVALALFSVYAIWGSTYLMMRFALEGFPPFIMGGVRFLMAGGLMYAFIRLRGGAAPTRREWGSAALVGALLCAVGNGGVAVAQQWVASSLAAVMVASMPLFAAFFSGVFGRWPGRVEWLGLGLGAVGVVFLNLDGDLRGSVAGAIALLISPAAWALGSVWSRRLPMPKGAMSSAAQMLVGGVLMSIAGMFQLDRFQMPGTRAVLALLYLVVFGSIVGFSSYQWLLRNVRPALATSYAYVNPLVAVLLGMSFGGEVLTRWAFVGTGLIILAVVLVVLGSARSVPAPAATAATPSPAGPEQPPLPASTELGRRSAA